MDYNIEVFRSVYPLWKCFVCHYNAYKEIHEVYNTLPGDIEFWTYTSDAHIEMATINWCMIFGNDSNETHWKRLNLSQSSFREQLFVECNINSEQWNSYWHEMIKFRNEYVAHRPKSFEEPVPNFGIAYRAIICLENWVREQIKPDIIEDPLLEIVATSNRQNFRDALDSIILHR